jgi:hypothetical protein
MKKLHLTLPKCLTIIAMFFFIIGVELISMNIDETTMSLKNPGLWLTLGFITAAYVMPSKVFRDRRKQKLKHRLSKSSAGFDFNTFALLLALPPRQSAHIRDEWACSFYWRVPTTACYSCCANISW